MHTPLPNVLDLKTALDAFHFLCLIEGKLMSIRACQRLGLGLERENPTELNDVENAVIKDDAWYETSRQLAGGDDFGEELVLNDSCIERILSQGHELWIHLLPETVYMHVATVNWVCVADYRRVTARMLQLAEVHYSVCVSQDEFKHWRERAINLLATACHTDCKRAKPTDRADYLALFERLKQRVDTVNPKGALRYPAL